MEKCTIVFTFDELEELALGPVPLEIALRCALNNRGFKFEDDGQPSYLLNKHPKPLGDGFYSISFMDRTVTFEQTISTH